MGINRDDPYFRVVFTENTDQALNELIQDRALSATFTDQESKMDQALIALDNRDLALFDAPALRKGAKMRLEWGYGNRSAPPRQLVVKSVKGWDTLTLEAVSPAILMTTDTRSRLFEARTRSEVARILAEEYGFTDEFILLDETTVRFDSILQCRESDAAFLARLARLEGFEFYVDHGGFHWHERRLGLDPVRQIAWLGRGAGDVIGVPTLENDVLDLHGLVTVKARDPATGQDAEESASNTRDTARVSLGEITEAVEPDVVITVNRRTGQVKPADFIDDPGEPPPPSKPEKRVTLASSEPVPDARQARSHARAKYRRRVLRTVKMRVTLVGDPLIAAKTPILFACPSKRISGRYWIRKAVHTIDDTGYRTVIDVISDGHGGHGLGRLVDGAGRSGGSTSPRGASRLDAILACAESVRRITVNRAFTLGGGQFAGPRHFIDGAVRALRSDGLNALDRLRGALAEVSAAARATADEPLTAAVDRCVALVGQEPTDETPAAGKIASARVSAGSTVEETVDADGQTVVTFRTRR